MGRIDPIKPTGFSPCASGSRAFWNGREMPMALDFAGEIYIRQEGRGMLLGTYEQERRPHAQAMIDLSTNLGRLLGLTSPAAARVRDWVLRTNGRTRPPLVTWAEHGGDRFVAAVENGPLSATQFHPEKSGDAGAALLRNWVESL